MHESKGTRMKRLAGTKLQTIINELTVLGIYGPLPDLGASIAFVSENGMPQATFAPTSTTSSFM